MWKFLVLFALAPVAGCSLLGKGFGEHCDRPEECRSGQCMTVVMQRQVTLAGGVSVPVESGGDASANFCTKTCDGPEDCPADYDCGDHCVPRPTLELGAECVAPWQCKGGSCKHGENPATGKHFAVCAAGCEGCGAGSTCFEGACVPNPLLDDPAAFEACTRAGAEVDACLRLASRYVDGDRAPVDPAQALAIRDRLCADGHAPACSLAGDQRVVAGERERAGADFRKGCEGGSWQACAGAAHLDLDARPGDRDALAALRGACGKRKIYADCSDRRFGSRTPDSEAFGRQICAAGVGGMCWEIGLEVLGADRTPGNPEALELFDRGCAAGTADACAMAGLMRLVESPGDRRGAGELRRGCAGVEELSDCVAIGAFNGAHTRSGAATTEAAALRVACDAGVELACRAATASAE